MPAELLPRDELVHAAERCVLHAALWDRGAADHARAVLPSGAFAGRGEILWALVSHHDETRAPTLPVFGPQPADAEPYDGPERVMSIWRTARDLTMPARPFGDRRPTLLARARHVGFTEHGVMLAASSLRIPDALTLPLALEVLKLAPAHNAAALLAATLDEHAAHILHAGSTPAPGSSATRPAHRAA